MLYFESVIFLALKTLFYDVHFSSPEPAMDVKDILLWRDVKVTAIVFVSGFVLLICMTQFSVVSVLTNIALVCLAPMLALRLLITARSAFLRSEFEHPLK